MLMFLLFKLWQLRSLGQRRLVVVVVPLLRVRMGELLLVEDSLEFLLFFVSLFDAVIVNLSCLLSSLVFLFGSVF